ncbi:IclR family transcriptional regulator [Persephonella atlantica]|uniref:IclR family transcriptional regulator n=1 Tax=Persephonella atlantica TaxID=2699429 RepID=A0ABS1GK59_9AQUI|nr:IclR family transcriptional regulator [Persephonella atlantica]MBK3333302.1 IclR family transcriptional regulator [Persephonella atlantica]
MHRKRKKNEYIVHNVDLAFDILFFLAKNPNTTFENILESMDSSSYQIEKTLEVLISRGYINFNPKKKTYTLGIKNFEVGYSYLSHVDIRNIARPYLQYLGEKFQENVYLAVRSGFEVVYIDSYEVSRPVVVKSRVGRLLPLYASASGKVHLADMDEDELEEFFREEKLVPYTKNTITDKDKLLEHIKLVREQGYAVDDEEWEEEVRCLSVPVRDHTGRVTAAVTLSAPSWRIPSEKLTGDIKDEFIKKAEELSERLGYTEE